MLIDLHRLSDLERVGAISVADDGKIRIVDGHGNRAIQALLEDNPHGFDTDGTEWDEDGNPCSVERIVTPSDFMFMSVVDFDSSLHGLCSAEKAKRLKAQRAA